MSPAPRIDTIRHQIVFYRRSEARALTTRTSEIQEKLPRTVNLEGFASEAKGDRLQTKAWK